MEENPNTNNMSIYVTWGNQHSPYDKTKKDYNIVKELICKIRGHKYSYNFGWMPTKCHCTRCGMKWKTKNILRYLLLY